MQGVGYYDFAGECKYRLLAHRKETDPTIENKLIIKLNYNNNEKVFWNNGSCCRIVCWL